MKKEKLNHNGSVALAGRGKRTWTKKEIESLRQMDADHDENLFSHLCSLTFICGSFSLA